MQPIIGWPDVLFYMSSFWDLKNASGRDSKNDFASSDICGSLGPSQTNKQKF